jgi:hypothetical protein
MIRGRSWKGDAMKVWAIVAGLVLLAGCTDTTVEPEAALDAQRDGLEVFLAFQDTLQLPPAPAPPSVPHTAVPEACVFVSWDADTLVCTVAARGLVADVRAFGQDVMYDGLEYLDTRDTFGAFATWSGGCGAWGGATNNHVYQGWPAFTLARAGGFTICGPLQLRADGWRELYVHRFLPDGTGPIVLRVVHNFDHVAELALGCGLTF